MRSLDFFAVALAVWHVSFCLSLAHTCLLHVERVRGGSLTLVTLPCIRSICRRYLQRDDAKLKANDAFSALSNETVAHIATRADFDAAKREIEEARRQLEQREAQHKAALRDANQKFQDSQNAYNNALLDANNSFSVQKQVGRRGLAMRTTTTKTHRLLQISADAKRNCFVQIS